MELTQDQMNRIRSMATQCLAIIEKQDRRGKYNVLIKLYTDQFTESNKARDYYGELQTWKNLTSTYEKHVKQCEIKMAELQKGLNASAAELQNEKGKTYRWYQAYNEQKASLEKTTQEQEKLKTELEALEQEKAKMQEQIDTLQKGASDERIQKLIAEQRSQDQANAELHQKNESLQQEIASLKSKIQELESQTPSSQNDSEVDDLNAENHQLRMQLDELQQKQPEQAKANKLLHEKNEKLLKEVDNLRNERQLLREQLEALENQASSRRERPARDDDDMDEDMEELLEEKEELEDTIDELKSVNQKLKEQLTQMEEKSKEAVMLQKKCQELASKNKYLQKRNDELEQEAGTDKKQDEPTIQEQFEKMGLNYDEMRQEIDNLKIERAQLIQQKNMLEAQASIDMEEIRKLREQLGQGGGIPSTEIPVSAPGTEQAAVPDVPEAPISPFEIATSTDAVDKYDDSKFLSIMLMGANIRMSEMPAPGAPIVLIGDKAYPNPYFYKGFLSSTETTSRVRSLTSVFTVEGLEESGTVQYGLKSIEPAVITSSVKTVTMSRGWDRDGNEIKSNEKVTEYHLEKKGRIVLLPDMK